jgi:hypothetical protein
MGEPLNYYANNPNRKVKVAGLLRGGVTDHSHLLFGTRGTDLARDPGLATSKPQVRRDETLYRILQNSRTRTMTNDFATATHHQPVDFDKLK